ncbi:MAG: hypothetical protein COA39_007970 [Sulfurimonas sp.]|nr:hypothetical protein [Sulfurimonas sp.]
MNKLSNLYNTENTKDPICHIKLFTPDSNWTWYITEISKISKEYDNTCFGLVFGYDVKLCYPYKHTRHYWIIYSFMWFCK